MSQSFAIADARATAAIDDLEANATMLELHGHDDSYVRAKIAGAVAVQDIYRRVFRGEGEGGHVDDEPESMSQ